MSAHWEIYVSLDTPPGWFDYDTGKSYSRDWCGCQGFDDHQLPYNCPLPLGDGGSSLIPLLSPHAMG